MPHSPLPDLAAQSIGFVLLPGFAMMSFASATEPLRAANLLAGRELYRIRHFGAESGEVISSGGIGIATDPVAMASPELSMLFVCAGGRPADWNVPQIHAALRRLSRSGTRLGGISGGAYVLATAGLLSGRDFTIHWEHAAALKEAFPDLEPRPARYVLDRDRLTCGGGVAPLDMMHALIGERMGPAFARRVSDWFLHTEIGEASAPQRAALAERYGVHRPALLAALERMEAVIEAPLSRSEIARYAGVSVRQLDRLFAGHLGRSFSQVYQAIRVRHAIRLLRQSPLDISEIALATGFVSPSHFARVIRAETGLSPSKLRKSGPGFPES
ncbi:GlxA family transcriptional regulator [Jiella avicenniae]|uniref:GlxA family transcriptional regulator n=1 Tax=Jiella avicenniae TaxID=2907202 RepID=A0A9X1P2C6_9HYPH|nr:GlxA family transcriptional regulator [Jiella avicenniae]MCE7028068.1 GlxA family transcriptional regulator [Jiella avicenniae]